MDPVASLYSSVQSTVIATLKREWQRYGWEDADIDDKAEKLMSLWCTNLADSGALHRDPLNVMQTMYQAESEANEKPKKRGRPSVNDQPNKRFKNAPQVQAPLNYPKLEMFSAMAQSFNQQSNTAILTGAARYANGLPILTAIVPETPPEPSNDQSSNQSTDQSTSQANGQPNNDQINTPQPDAAPAQPDQSLSQSINQSSDASNNVSVKSEFARARVAASQTVIPNQSDSQSNNQSIDDPLNNLAREPLSNLDDDSDLEMDVSNVKDVCIAQYERIGSVKNAKNKWRVVIRDGIINVKGRDYVFSRATGELHW